jgi:hypothetical protein
MILLLAPAAQGLVDHVDRADSLGHHSPPANQSLGLTQLGTDLLGCDS